MSGSARPLAVVDIDGVVADVRHRLRFVQRKPKDWDAFFAAASEDPPLADGISRVTALAGEHDIVFLTGRPERCRRQTEAWLTAAGIGGWPVVMRRNDDRRPARQTKLHEVRALAANAQVAIVLDDDPDVCASLTGAGYVVERADWMTRPDALHAAQEKEGRT